MTRNQIIEALFKGKNFNDCIGKMEPEHLREDLKMEVALIVCEWPDERIVGLHERKELEFFVVRVILNQIQSNSSPFYKKYRKASDPYEELSAAGDFGGHGDGNTLIRHKAHIVDLATSEYRASHPEDIGERQQREDKEDRAISEIDNLYWYNREIVNLYRKHGNYRAIEKETGIPFISCYKTIQKSFRELKQKVLQ